MTNPTPTMGPGVDPRAAAKADKAYRKAMRPWYAKKRTWLGAAVLLIIIIAVASSMNQGGSANQKTSSVSGQTAGATAPAAAPAAKAKLTLDDGWAIDKSNQFAVYVNGYVSNNTDKAITNYIQITFDALDKNGANLGTCLANTNTVDANGKWKFKAICSGDAKEIATVRFKELTGF